MSTHQREVATAVHVRIVFLFEELIDKWREEYRAAIEQRPARKRC